MASVELTNEQIIELVRQFPTEAKQEVLRTLAIDSEARRTERMAVALEQIRRLAAQRGLNWDTIERTRARIAC